MKLFLRSVRCVIDTAHGTHTLPVSSMLCNVHILLIMLLFRICFFFIYYWLFITFFAEKFIIFCLHSPALLEMICYITFYVVIICDGTNNCTLSPFQIIFCQILKVALSPPVGNTQRGLSDSMCVCVPLNVCIRSRQKQSLGKETSNLFRHIIFFVEKLAGAQPGVSRARGQPRSENILTLYVHESSGLWFGTLHSHRLEQWEVDATVHLLVLGATGKSSVHYNRRS